MGKIKKMKTVVITGSSGLIGSQAVNFFHEKGYKVVGIDNDMRAYFFGEQASTKESNNVLIENIIGTYQNIDNIINLHIT